MKKNKNLFFMQKALLQAKIAFNNNEVPVGAVVVDADGNILSFAYNRIEEDGTQISHAEVLAIKKACKKLGDWRLDGCSIYVTLEPCLMCFGLIQLSRIKKLYFGSSSNEFGSGLKQAKESNLNKSGLSVTGGLLESECTDILKLFFKGVRSKRKRRTYCGTKT